MGYFLGTLFTVLAWVMVCNILTCRRQLAAINRAHELNVSDIQAGVFNYPDRYGQVPEYEVEFFRRLTFRNWRHLYPEWAQ